MVFHLRPPFNVAVLLLSLSCFFACSTNISSKIFIDYAKCDVLAMWCHITFGGDIFITSDRNFFRKTKKPHLIALGARDILTPQGAVAKLEATLGFNAI